MATPKAGYRLASGERIPGTTTVIGRFKDAGGLLFWAFQQGKEGKATLYEESGKAADIGTAAHRMVELHNLGGSPESVLDAFPGDRDKVLSAYTAYLDWERMTKVKIISGYQEVQLVSETHKFGGTPDAIGEIEGKLVLLDWKTSNGVYVDHLIQLAAYRQLWNECRPDTPLTGGSHLLRFSKEHGDFAHHHFPDLSDAWRQFVLFREAYDIDKQLKKRAA